MNRFPRHSTYPWARSLEESLPRSRTSERHVTLPELLAVLVVVSALVAMAVWFVFFSAGGIGPGTV